MAAGRPSKYKPEIVAQAAKLCRLGATDRDLADFFEVAESTISLWKLEHEEFSEALKLAKAQADARVEQSLYRRALGYSHDAVKILQADGAPLIVPYVEHYPPDTTACIFWLKNRKPEEWRDVHHVAATVKHTVETGDGDSLTDRLRRRTEERAPPPSVQ